MKIGLKEAQARALREANAKPSGTGVQKQARMEARPSRAAAHETVLSPDGAVSNAVALSASSAVVDAKAGYNAYMKAYMKTWRADQRAKKVKEAK